MTTRNNLDNAVLSISRVGTFSDGEKDALIKAFRGSGFPGNFLITNPSATEVLRFDGTNWVNSTGGATAFTGLTDTPASITANGFVKGNSGGTALEQVVNVAETDATETISGAWNFTTQPTINNSGVVSYNTSLTALADVGYFGGPTQGDVLVWTTGLPNDEWRPYTLTFEDFNPMTTSQDIIVGGASGVGTRLGAGLNGQVLTMTAGTVGWAASAAGFTDPMTTRGDVIIRDATNTTARLAIGATGTYLKSDGTDISWTAPAFDDTSPMTTNEDIIKQSGGTATRLPVGTNDQVLTVTAGVVGWATPASGFSNPMTTRGDIIYMDATTTTSRLPIGTAGQVLTSDGTDVSWAAASGGGASDFLTLTDTPSSYTGQASKWLRVNALATAVEFTAPPVESVSGSGAISSTGGVTPIISVAAASGSTTGTITSTEWTKLSGIEAGADVTDAGNVAAAGAIMDSNYSVDGFQVRLTSTSYTTRTFSATTPVNITNGDGQAGAPVISIDAATTTGSGAVELATTTETNTGTDATRAVTPAGLAAWTGSTAITTLGTISGTLTATALNATSARDKKTEVPWFIDPDRLQYLQPIAYQMNDHPTAVPQIGYFADEMANQYPEICGYTDGKATSIDYSRLVVPLIEKIKELELRLSQLENS